MSPTVAPADSWISDFEDLIAPASTSSGSFSNLAVLMATSGASGGTDGEYDGGAKRSHLFFYSVAMARSRTVCLGVVGSGGCRFCIKKNRTCTAKSHALKFGPTKNTFYLKGNDTCAHMQPCLPGILVPPNELPVIQASKHTIEEWTNIFACYGETRTDDGGPKPLNMFNKVTLKTPAKSSTTSTTDADLVIYSPKGIREIMFDFQDDDWLGSLVEDFSV